MSDMYGAVRSNEFKVKDIKAFKKWFKQYSFGEETDVWTHITGMNGADDYSGTVSFGSMEQYPNAHPMVAVLDGDGEIEHMIEADLDFFAIELRQHLQPKEIFQVVAGGHEKLRYVGFTELLIAEDVKNHRWNIIYSDDSESVLRERLMHGIMK